jgi:glucose-6-phosphate isomerase
VIKVPPLRNVLNFSSGEMVPHRAVAVQGLRGMRGAYADQEAVAALLDSGEDPVIYRAFDGEVPPHQAGHLAYRTTVVLPGDIGGEYYMTKGHHHHKDSAELYLGMSGTGLMLMRPRDGDLCVEELGKDVTVYVPPGWAHRTVNTGSQELVFLAVYFSDAGHDYGSVQQSGFGARVLARASGPEVVPTHAVLPAAGGSRAPT